MYEERTLHDKNGTQIGTIFNKNMYKSWRKPEHFFRKYRGFGLSKWVLQELQESNVLDIFIYYTGKEGLKIYYSPIEKWQKLGILFVYKDGNDVDPQLILPVDEMKVVE